MELYKRLFRNKIYYVIDNGLLHHTIAATVPPITLHVLIKLLKQSACVRVQIF